MLGLRAASRTTATRIPAPASYSHGRQRRYLQSAATESQHSVLETHEGWLFVDSVFPIRLARWDLRHYIGIFREEALLSELESCLESFKAHDFKILSLEPHEKDGGVFVRFSYSASDPDVALSTIESKVREEVDKHGGFPSWLGIGGGNAWVVKGTPWREDMNRFASPIVKVAFEGPDIHEQSLYQLLRPYGRISDLTHPGPAAPGTLRSSIVTFDRVHSATIARNVVHGFSVPSALGGGPHIGNDSETRLRTAYQRPIQAHAIRDWMSSHPKIMLPILVFLLGTLTYTIFDPVRSLMVQAQMLNWFNYREFRVYKWLRKNGLDRLASTFTAAENHENPLPVEEVWGERKDAIAAVKAYLTDVPTTITFVYGPQGSGKTSMLQTILEEAGRHAMIIDCRELHKASSDSQLVGVLAEQTGYWPVFTYLNSLNSLLDLASVGLIGQKAGLSSSLADQLQQILSVVGTALKGVNFHHRNAMKRQAREDKNHEIEKEREAQKREKIKRGIWHDGRLDCVAGNGVMSELGMGDELFGEDDGDLLTSINVSETSPDHKDDSERKQKIQEDLEVVRSLPIIIIRNYATKLGSSREELLEVLARWAATLVENQIAHVIVISDNRENFKLLTKALPSKPLNIVALSDADSGTSLSFVKQKLRDADIDINFTQEQMAYVERLGGRASDLESLIHKVRGGQCVEEAVEDIISRSVGELRKSAFGDDADDAKSLPWSRQQAWMVLKLLSNREEIPYHDLLLEYPFKGDDSSLRSMEHAELISIGTHEGRPSMIRPGKPVFRWAFERLVNDPVFHATQDIAFNDKVIENSENKIRAFEEELVVLKDIAPVEPWWRFGIGRKHGTSLRKDYLFHKILAAEKKIEALEKMNLELRKVLVKGG